MLSIILITIIITTLILVIMNKSTTNCSNEHFGIIAPTEINPNDMESIETQNTFILNQDMGNNGVDHRNNPIINDDISFEILNKREKHYQEIEYDKDFDPIKLVWETVDVPKYKYPEAHFSRKDIENNQNEVFGFINRINLNTSNEVDPVDKINELFVTQGNELKFDKNKTIASIFDSLTKNK